MNTQELVEQIHNEFNNASDVSLLEATQEYEKLKNVPEGDIDLAKQMDLAGFNRAKPVESLMNIHNKKEELSKQSKLILHKNVIDPVHKFITEDKVIEICEKYGLVYGPSDNYTGDMPVKNMKDISNFKPNSKEVEVAVRIDKSAIIQYYKLKDIYNEINIGPETIGRQGMNQGHIVTMPKWIADEHGIPTNPIGYFICAPEKDFDMTGKEMQGRQIVDKKEIPDPVVIYKVIDGYRIVTAWGPEAEDETIVNEKMN